MKLVHLGLGGEGGLLGISGKCGLVSVKIDFRLCPLTAKVLKFHRLALLLILSSRLWAGLDDEVVHLIDLARCRAFLIPDGSVGW